MYSIPLFSPAMDYRHRRKRMKTTKHPIVILEEVSSLEWEFIKMSEEEDDLINRMYRLIGNRWHLIAGRIPGRKADEIERYWMMKHCQQFAERRFIQQPDNQSKD